MFCKICEKDIEGKFYLHVNNYHKNLKEYFLLFPEQEDEYKKNKPNVWNKGLTALENDSIKKYSLKIKEYSNREDVKEKRSNLMKKRYLEDGDIIPKEERLIYSKLASSAWVAKIKNSTFEERKKLLKNFTTAGNEKQSELRKNYTVEDYKRLYPFAKGEFVLSTCDFCKSKLIVLKGGKKRPSKNFCDKDCYAKFLIEHPNYCLGGCNRIDYFSSKMNKNYTLLSNLEFYIAKILDNSDYVENWCVCPHIIEYEFEGKIRKYYPDFLINNKIILEVKSSYIFTLSSVRTIVKLEAATNWCIKNDFIFLYWEFGERNLTLKKVEKDARIREFFLGRD